MPAPVFAPAYRTLVVPGRLVSVATRGADGTSVDHTTLNARGGGAFLPFGERGAGNQVLVLTFTCNDDDGPLGADRRAASGALWAIGVRAAPPLGGAAAEPSGESSTRPSSLVATFVTEDARIPVRIASDSTQSLLATGALLLDLASVPAAKTFRIELQSSSGFDRPPRLLRIEPNVVPIRQGTTMSRERHPDAKGSPSEQVTLDARGLRFEAGDHPIVVEVAEGSSVTEWTRCDRLSDRDPGERVYELETSTGELTFGNGVNGALLPAGADVLVSYAVCDAEQGNVARNRVWHVAGFAGGFGVNPDPVAGGAAATSFDEQRRAARALSREDHPLVSASDIAAAAMALPLLEVARAWMPAPDERAPRTGTATLIAMRARPAGNEPDAVPETARWLEAIRRRLAPRMPLGVRLVVVAPRYVGFTIDATIESEQARAPESVRRAVNATLMQRLALVDAGAGVAPREPGVPLTRRDLTAWIRATDGVRRVVSLQLLDAAGATVEKIVVTASGLPRWSAARSTIVVNRPAAGSRP
jgi:hypothetical protein